MDTRDTLQKIIDLMEQKHQEFLKESAIELTMLNEQIEQAKDGVLLVVGG